MSIYTYHLCVGDLCVGEKRSWKLKHIFKLKKINKKEKKSNLNKQQQKTHILLKLELTRNTYTVETRIN